MARRAPRGKGAANAFRRAWPLLLAAYERWQALPESEKEKYRRRAREAAARGRKTIDRRRAGRRS